MSADGRYVAFASASSNLEAGDTNGTTDVFVRNQLAQTTRRVSITSAGVQADGASGKPSISADGRYVAFESTASNLVPGDTNGTSDIFLWDRLTGEITRVSAWLNGWQLDGVSRSAAISGDGRYIAFVADYESCNEFDSCNWFTEVYLRDRQIGTLNIVSRSSGGLEAEGNVADASVSYDGRYVAFASNAPRLVGGDTNNTWDVFRRDTTTSATTRVSVNSTGAQANGASSNPSISSDGSRVAFESVASNLASTSVDGQPDADTNNVSDVFRRDFAVARTNRVSREAGGPQPNAASLNPAISGDGQRVVFETDASNVHTGDHNGTRDVIEWRSAPGTFDLLSFDDNLGQANGPSTEPSISPDGSVVAFISSAPVFGASAAAPGVFSHTHVGAAGCAVAAIGVGIALSQSTDPGGGSDRHAMRVQLQEGNLNTYSVFVRNSPSSPATTLQVREAISELYGKARLQAPWYPFNAGESQLVEAIVTVSDRLKRYPPLGICEATLTIEREVWTTSGRSFRLEVENLAGCNLMS